jgi:transcriptional regulator with XRE-family HTH domain
MVRYGNVTKSASTEETDMADDLDNFASRLRSVRVSYGQVIDLPAVTAAQFAQLVGVWPGTYGAYERGERDPPASFLASLRRRTGVDLNWLCCGDASES